jgi:hypothetical protein
LRERLQERFLGGVFGLAAVAEKSMRDMKDSGAVSSDNFCEGRLVFCACLPRQFKIGRLFVTVRQKRSSVGSGGALGVAQNFGRLCSR